MIVQQSHEKQKTRIRAILRLKEGMSKTAVADEFVVTRITIRSWVEAYNAGGVDALSMSKGGRSEGNPVWRGEIFDELTLEIDQGGYWSVPKMQKWIKEHYGADIPEQTVWYRINKRGYSYKSARPQPDKGDRDAQETFQKGGSSTR